MGNYAGYARLVQDRTTRRSVNFANIQKVKTKEGGISFPWDIENFSLSWAYSDITRTNVNIANYSQRLINYGAGYSYASSAKGFEPFSKMKVFDSPYLKLIKDFNFNPLPASISLRADINRFFTRQQLRSSNIYAPLNPALLTFEKSITFNRTYGLRWSPAKSITLDYSANANAVVDEPAGEIKGDKAKRDTILRNVRNLGRMKTYNQNIRAGYKLPFDKLPFTDWINADVAYTASVNWSASQLALQDTLGNILQNSRDRAINGKLDLLKLYNKVKFLADVNNPKPRTPRAKAKPLTPAEKAKIKKDKADATAKAAKEALAARLAKNKKPVLDKDGKPIEPLAEQKALAAAAEAAKGKKKDKDTTKKREFKLVKGILRLLMSARSVNFQYQVTENTLLPGYKPTPMYAGATESDGGLAPTIPFLLGDQNPDIRYTAAAKGWLGRTRYQNQQFQQAITSTFSANATIEPLKDFRVRVDVRRTQSDNYREFFRLKEDQSGFGSFNPTRGGAYNISFFTLKSFQLFQGKGEDDFNRSVQFRQFEANRSVIANRLTFENRASEINRPVGGDTSQYHTYNLNSQDVLIPSFIAAYQGKSAASTKLSAFPKIPLPNWRIDYAGLSKIPWIGERFPSVNLTHSYASTYSVDNFISSLKYGSDTVQLNKPIEILPSQGNSTGSFASVYNMQQVVISEKFAPLVGINIRTKNKITIRLDYNRDRSMALNVSNAQITELRSQDITFGLGFAKSGVKLPFKDKGRPIILKNELTMRADLTVRDNLQIQRKINDLNQITNGGLDIQFKPTANYVVNQRLNIQTYFERTINRPRLASSYLRKVWAFGIQLRFALQ